MPQAALGIPDRSDYGDPFTGLTPGQLADWVVQQHQAARAGLHHDIRLGSPETGLYSWAARKGLPAPGQKHLAVQQPLHAHDYRDFEGTIPSGYGAGQVKKKQFGQVLVTRVEPNAIHFSTAQGRFPERYALIKPKTGKNWLLLNTTKTEVVPHEKVHYTSVPAAQAKEVLAGLQPGSSVQAKVDGAASLTKLFKDHVEVLSYRPSATGRPIPHTERIFHQRPGATIPKELVGSVLRGEIYGVDSAGRAIPPQTLGGLLNAGLARSLRTQQETGVKLRNMLFDVPAMSHLPYADRRRKLEEILKHLPAEQFHLPEEATTPEAAQALWQQVRSGEHPLTNEGLVIHPATGVPTKIKQTAEHDVHIRGIFPGEGKYEGTGAGGFSYSHEPTGPIVGRVGTGLSDELRRSMGAAPEDYIGQVARVEAASKFPSGALRAPALIALHTDYVAPAAAAQAATATGTPALTKMRQRSSTNLANRAGPALSALRQAKAESDRENYKAKHDTLRQLILQEPHNFKIDSTQGRMVGITHKPSGFRLHMPATAVPDVLRSAEQEVTSP